MSMLPRPKDMLTLLYKGSSRAQVERAENIAAWLQREPALPASLHVLLPQLGQEATKLTDQMRALGMGEACSLCAARSFGGCCSAYMAANCDVVLLVLNRLLGTDLRIQTHENQGRDACCFLDPAGCIFLVKPIFCLNYYCGHLQERIAPADMQKLQTQTSRVLGLQCAFEEQLLQLLRHAPDTLILF